MTRSSALVLPTLTFALILAACSSTTAGSDASTQDASSDSPVTDSAADSQTDAGACVAILDGGAQCNTLTNSGTAVALVVTGMAMPVGTGGAISDGRYLLSAFKAYNGSALTMGSLKQTLEICGTVGQLIGEDDGKPQYRKTFTIMPNGIAPHDMPVCTTQSPNVEINSSSYTATSTALTLFSSMYSISVTYTKQ